MSSQPPTGISILKQLITYKENRNNWHDWLPKKENVQPVLPTEGAEFHHKIVIVRTGIK